MLELLYCQPCGEIFTGGFKKIDPSTANAWYLSPDFPELDHVPDKSASLDKMAPIGADDRPTIRRPKHKVLAEGFVWQETSENTNFKYRGRPLQVTR